MTLELTCPKCGSHEIDTLEILTGAADVSRWDELGEPEFGGYTDIHDDQATIGLICGECNAHAVDLNGRLTRFVNNLMRGASVAHVKDFGMPWPPPASCTKCGVNITPPDPAISDTYREPHCRDCELEMMSEPSRWPMGDVLPLKRRRDQAWAQLRHTGEGFVFINSSAEGRAPVPTTPEDVYDAGWRVD